MYKDESHIHPKYRSKEQLKRESDSLTATIRYLTWGRSFPWLYKNKPLPAGASRELLKKIILDQTRKIEE